MAEYDAKEGVVKMGAGAATGAAAGSVIPGIGTAIGAGIGALGGLLGGFMSNEYNEEMAERALAFQREAAQNSIQWRVNDAKAAGLHPLYALGAAPYSAPAITVQDSIGPSIREASQDIGNAVSRMSTTKDKLVEALQLDMLTSQAARAKSEAGIAFEQEIAARRANQNAEQSGLGIHTEGETVPDSGQVPAVRGFEAPGAAIQGFFENKAPQRMSPSKRDTAFESQYGAGYQEWELRPGFYLTTPMTGQESWREVLSEMSVAEKFGLLNQNATIYGGEWLKDYLKWEYFGQEPKNRYHPHTGPGGTHQRRHDIIQDFFNKYDR